MKHYSQTGRRNHGRPFKRLLDTWDRNGSTSGPSSWQIYDDDDDDDDATYNACVVICTIRVYFVCMFNSSPTRCTLYYLFLSWQRKLYVFRVLFAPIIRNTTAAYSHRFCMVLVCYSIGAGTGLGHLKHFSTVSYRLCCLLCTDISECYIVCCLVVLHFVCVVWTWPVPTRYNVSGVDRPNGLIAILQCESTVLASVFCTPRHCGLIYLWSVTDRYQDVRNHKHKKFILSFPKNSDEGIFHLK
jgi:hypothetical protein